MKDYTRKNELTAQERADLKRLEAMPEHLIDTDDIPEAPLENMKRATRGKNGPPVNYRKIAS